MSGISGLVPMAHVADLPRSIAFYQQLGFAVCGDWKHADRLVWASLRSGAAWLYLSQADAPIDPKQQAVLFYLYSPDLQAMRARLIAEGVTVSEVTYPPYMPKGEVRVDDPDGYCLLIGQED
jgi:catechol 2,3-dioxygenase-like lactoylglutathione lyase family enzyme